MQNRSPGPDEEGEMARADARIPRMPLSAAVLLSAAVALSGCEQGGSEGRPLLSSASATRTVERDVEMPEVFQREEPGLWDGRPSLGGIWAAHPDAADPERVVIRNTETGASVTGALFRREREQPGPRFQLSSEAANALGILPGRPTPIRVTALRLEQVPVAPAPAAEVEDATAEPTPDAAEPETPRGLRALFQRRQPAPAPDAQPDPLPEAETTPASRAATAPAAILR